MSQTKQIAALTLAFGLVAQVASAQTAGLSQSAAPSRPHTIIHLDPLGAAFGIFGLGYERVLSRYASLRIGAQYSNPWDNDDIWGVGGEIRPYFYLLGRAPTGLYIAPLFRGAFARGEKGSASGSGFAWAAGGTIGWAWLLGPVDLRIGLGALYLDMQVTAKDGTDTLKLGSSGVAATGDLSIGFAF